MAYEMKDGDGSLFRDTSERNKDYDGKCMIGGQMYWISGWRKPGKDGKPDWLSLSFKPADQTARNQDGSPYRGRPSGPDQEEPAF